jgi:peptide chain release factor 3
MTTLPEPVARRRTFAIISHPDAGKTTLTEKLLLFGGAIQLAGAVKARGDQRRARSDWMKVERERGISVASSVMTFEYGDCTFNLLDTPGHEDFSEDTYRTLSAVDSAVMVLDSARGIQAQTRKLFEVCRLRDVPIITFINKLDRDGQEPFDLLDEVQQTLALETTPASWPIGMGRHFLGCFDLFHDRLRLVAKGTADAPDEGAVCNGIDDPKLDSLLPDHAAAKLREEVEMARGLCPPFDLTAYREGHLTPVFFGSAINNFGVRELIDGLAELAPPPRPYKAGERMIAPEEDKVSGFVFKIQANMDPDHRDRIAFLRICSGGYRRGMRLHHVRLGKEVRIADALTFMAADRQQADEAWAGDIIGLHNHGTINIGDTFTEGEPLTFTGIPNFAPELFRRAVLKDPLRMKALQKGLDQLCEEGATQLFRPLRNNDVILGAVGPLQFDVVAFRLADEYGVSCAFEPVNVVTARWIDGKDPAKLGQFRDRAYEHLALDHAGELVYLAPSRVNLNLTVERWPDLRFRVTREHLAVAA